MARRYYEGILPFKIVTTDEPLQKERVKKFTAKDIGKTLGYIKSNALGSMEYGEDVG